MQRLSRFFRYYIGCPRPIYTLAPRLGHLICMMPMLLPPYGFRLIDQSRLYRSMGCAAIYHRCCHEDAAAL